MPDFRSLPSVDGLMREPELASFTERVRSMAARQAVAVARKNVESGKEVDKESVSQHAKRLAEQLSGFSLKSAINMSGVVLHTGLGRSRLSKAAQDQILNVARDHATVEFDIETGKRGDRQSHVRDLLKELTGAEDAFVVNNCAAAVYLSLSALCHGREVVLSRGQMVEIGGSFRMPDIVRQSGCKLVEVGCTNKTRVSDYSKSFTDNTAAILRCHPSNFKVVGFHEAPSAQDLSALCKEHGHLLIDDVGSGCLVDTTEYGLPKEQTLQEAVKSGADIVMASGDKLMGGAQAGIMLGTKDAIDQVRRHPLARAIRIDKLTLAGLEATLKLYINGREKEIPVWKYLGRSANEVKKSANAISKACSLESTVEKGQTEVGGGSMPTAFVETYRVGIKGRDPMQISADLRASERPVVGYVEDDTFWLDPRTIEESEVKLVCEYVKNL